MSSRVIKMMPADVGGGGGIMPVNVINKQPDSVCLRWIRYMLIRGVVDAGCQSRAGRHSGWMGGTWSRGDERMLWRRGDRTMTNARTGLTITILFQF